MSQLAQLTQPFPDEMIHRKPGKGGGDYVEHATIVQRLLQVVGPFDFYVKRVIKEPDGRISGAVCILGCRIDDQYVQIEECGDCENLDNWPTDGARLKVAVSDAIKRCAARLGLGLHLWAQDEFYLHDSLIKRETTEQENDE